MGQRHQAFVIARVRPYSTSAMPPKYRCIAAFHHQWCYGRLPLKATHRFITQVKQKANVEIIRSEIAAIQGKFRDRNWGSQGPEIPYIPCPFTAFLLATNWSVDLEIPGDPYTSVGSFAGGMLPADMDSGGGDNNDGISVIDVTDPTAPSYCFVSVSGIEAQKAVPECVPLSAEQYVRAYYPKCTPPVEAQSDEMEKKIEEDVQATIELLKDVKLVELAMLAEAWPAEYNLDGKMQNPADTPAKPVSADLPSLVELTMPLAVEQAIQTGEVKDIEAMIWIPEKASMIKAFLRQMSPFPDGGIELLKTLAEAEISTPNAELDLTGFTLSTSQLGNLLSSMKKTVDVVNLSQMSTLTIDDVRMVLRVPQLKRLILLDCPLVSSDDIHSLLRTEPSLFNQLEALIHPSLLSGLNDMDDSRPYHSAFSCIGMGFGTVEACSLPFFNLPHIIQALHDVLQPLRVNLSAQWSSLLMQAAFSSVRRPGQAWSERNTVIIPQFSLAGLRGEGWTFAFTVDFKGGSFAFLRLNSRRFITSDNEQAEAESDTASGSDETKELGWEIHDLASFIDQAVLDGKARPTDEAVNMLQDTLTGFQTSTGLQKQWMQLMNDDDVKQLIANARFRY